MLYVGVRKLDKRHLSRRWVWRESWKSEVFSAIFCLIWMLVRLSTSAVSIAYKEDSPQHILWVVLRNIHGTRSMWNEYRKYMTSSRRCHVFKSQLWYLHFWPTLAMSATVMLPSLPQHNYGFNSFEDTRVIWDLQKKPVTIESRSSKILGTWINIKIASACIFNARQKSMVP